MSLPLVKVTGTISDAKTGERLIGAVIAVEGTKKGAKTNLNGEFSLQVEAGTYNLKVSYLGYKKKILENAQLDPGETNHIDILLESSTLQGEDVVVTTKIASETQTAQLMDRKRAATMNDAISAEQIRRSPDATSGDAIKRISGVTIVDNKFVEIRGTSERYNNAVLNHSALASTEPDKKSFSFDLLPSNLIDNTVVSKTFTPDLPANFAGGLVQVNTVNFPDKFSAKVSLSGGYNTSTTGAAFTSYQTGGSDWLGFDDGTRALPSGFPTTSISDASISPQDIQKYGLLFKNNWAPKIKSAGINKSFAFSIGDQFTIADNDFGYIGSLSYKTGYDHNSIQRNDYNGDKTPIYERSGSSDVINVLWGGLFNITYKLNENSIISLRNLYDKTSDDQVVVLAGKDYANAFQDKQTSFHYTERSLYSGQLTGEHLIEDFGKTKIEWRLSHAASTRSEPDLRRYVFARDFDAVDNAPYYASISASPDPKTGGRFFSDMSEQNNEGGLDITIPISSSKLKVGGMIDSRTREFSARVLAYKLATSNFSLLFSSIDTLFAPEHIGPQGFQIAEITNPSDHYDAAEHIGAGYAMLDLPFTIGTSQLRFIGGARIEQSSQQLNSGILGGGAVHYDRPHTDVLPSINVVYSVNDQTNIRLAATQTVSRPEFREIAPFAFYDFELGSLIQGDTNIDRALIRNLDFRVEYYPTAGELLSISAFHKRFEGAIEATDQGSNSVKSWANAKQPAINYGVELEIRKSLGFFGNFFSNFIFSGNYTYIVSKVNVHELTNGQQEERPMQGQSPYSINLGLLFVEPNLGTSVNLLYNTYGKRIAEVNPYTGDLYEMPRDLVDLSISQSLFEKLEVKYTIKDILAQPQLFVNDGKVNRSNQRGSVHSFSVSVKL